MSGGELPEGADVPSALGDDLPTPSPSRKREGSETCQAEGAASRSGVGQTAATLPTRTRKPRHNEWTREKMAVFLRELAATQSVAAAAAHVGMSRQSAYRLRDRLMGTPFSFGWDVALEMGLSRLAHAMMERALNGVEVPHFYQGEQIGTSRYYDERLSIWLMNNPWKVGRRQIAREYSAEAFDALLARIAEGPLDWSDGDELPGRGGPSQDIAEADRRQSEFMGQGSWYAALAAEDAPKK